MSSTVVAPAKTVTVARKRNKRSENTIQTILMAAERIILKSGVDRVSILDVCNEAEISRGTFYRYFSSQDELLDAFSRHKRDRFHESMSETMAPYSEPDERFDAFIRYLDDYLQEGRAHKMLLVAPDYAVGWFQRIYHDSVSRFLNELSIVFDAWDERTGVTIDRELVCELMIRYILSEQLVPSTKQARKALPNRIRRLMLAMIKS